LISYLYVEQKRLSVAHSENSDLMKQAHDHWQEGVDSWNQWRSKNRTVGVSFQKADFRNADLSGVDLSNTNLNYADLSGANLHRAILGHAYLMHTNLSGANLSEAEIDESNLCNANLSEANLTHANLTDSMLVGANLSCANLQYASLGYARVHDAFLDNANLSNASLNKTDLRDASLNHANLNEANLSGANLGRANLSEANLSKANLGYNSISDSITNLSEADLGNADLSHADLSSADLSNADLSNADLTGAMLGAVRALGTNFSSAILTGACFQNWNINSETKLDSVICAFFYLEAEYYSTENKYCFRERRPSDDSHFAPGEVVTLLQSVLATIDLVFVNGIDWKAFFLSFQELQTQYGSDNLSIQAIEKKSDKAFVIRLETSLEASKAEVEYQVKELYKHKLQLLEAQYRANLHAKDREIESYKRESTNMMEIAKLLASKPITVEAKAVAGSQSNSDTFNTDLRGANVANFANKVQDNARQQTNQNIYTVSEKQSLAEAAAEIQKLLKILEQSNPYATEADQQAFVSAAIAPTLKQRAVNAIQSGGKIAIAEFLDNPYLNVAIAIIEGWQNNDGA
jgi:uncharacterized protein YjbI with pentapeptide repeats